MLFYNPPDLEDEVVKIRDEKTLWDAIVDTQTVMSKSSYIYAKKNMETEVCFCTTCVLLSNQTQNIRFLGGSS
jgi:hypothetical protein